MRPKKRKIKQVKDQDQEVNKKSVLVAINKNKNLQNEVVKSAAIHLHEAVHTHPQNQAAAHHQDPADPHVEVKIVATNDNLANNIMIIRIVQKTDKEMKNSVEDNKEDDHHKIMVTVVDKCHHHQNLM